VEQPLPLALTTLATLALGAGLLLPEKAPIALRKLGALLMNESKGRVVPVTRRPLRAQTQLEGPSWPALLGAAETATLDERRTLLRALFGESSRTDLGVILAAAAREEQGDLRLTALRGLVAGAHAEGLEVFRDALRIGTDSERSLSIDGLARLGALDELPAAFNDRLEPLAAKAALAFAASRERGVLEEALEDRVDAGRRDAILRLLAGILE